MGKFRFRLQTVLEQRKRAEDDALRVVASAQRKLAEARAKKAAFEAALLASCKRRELLGETETSVENFHVEQAFIDGTKQRLIQADHHIGVAQRGVDKAMRGFLATRRATRQIEVIEEKDRLAHRAESKKKELRAQDELSVLRARFKNQGDIS